MSSGGVGWVQLLGDLGSRLGDAVGPLTLATSLILGGAWLVDRALARRVSAAWRLLLYAAVLVRVLLPVGWQSPLGLFPGRATAPLITGGDLTLIALDAAVSVPAARFDATAWLGLVYLAVTAALLVRFVGARVRLRGQLRAATAFGREAGTPVWRHPVLGPFVAGLWRPHIVLPAALTDGDRDADTQARDWILRHELAHIRRRDPWLNACLQLACCLAWPILPLWVAAHRMRSLMEEACDELAVAGADGASRRRYGEVLLALAQDRLPGRFAHVLGFPALGSPLRSRLRALATRNRWPAALQGLAVAVLGAAALACGGENDGEIDGGQMDTGDVGAASLQVQTEGTPPAGSGLSAPGYLPGAVRFGVKPTIGRPPRLLHSDLKLAPEVTARSAAQSQRTVPKQDRLRQTAPGVWIGHDGAWLCTPRRGCSRMGGWKSLETALREALEETGARAVLIDAYETTPAEQVQEMAAAAKRAGAEELAVSVLPRTFTPLPSADPGGSAVPYGHLDPVLTITRTGDLYLGHNKVAPQDLEKQLRRRLKDRESHTLLIRGDKEVLLSAAVDYMAIAKRAGATNVGLLSAPPSTPAAKQGTLDPQIMNREVRARMGSIRACYERQLAYHPDLGGRVQVNFTVRANGTVEEPVRVDTTADLAAVGDCIAKIIEKWRLPAPEGGGEVAVSYPFLFRPKTP